MSKVRVGIIGTGGMAQGHIQRLLQNPEAEITALCDIRQSQLDKTVERHPKLQGVRQFEDFRDMIAAGNLDAVQIVTPHTTHYEQIIGCLDKDLHVFCEKPMTCKVQHAHNVLRKVEETGKVFVLGYQRHYQPEFLYMKEKIASGELGKVQFVQGLQGQEWLKGCRGSWRHDPAFSGGGQLNDSGSHLLAVLLFVTGLGVDQCSGFIDNFDVPVDINTALSIKFVGGAQGNVSVVGNSPCWYEDITIWCEKGAFFMRQGQLEFCDADGKRSKPDVESLPKGNNPDDNFIAAIQGKETVGSPGIWGLRVIELTEAAWDAAATNAVSHVKHA